MLTFIPIGLLSLISACRSSLGMEPVLYDLNRRILDGTIPLGSNFYRDAAAAIVACEPDLVGFMTENESYHHVLQICDEIKRAEPRCTIVLGGPHASAVAAATLKSWECVDYIVKGEGEVSFPHIVNNCLQGKVEPVPGVWARSTDGQVCFGGPRPLIKDLNTLNYPAYELYQPELGEEIFFEVGRGCPFQCTFCSTAPFWERAHRVKSADRIVEELKYLLGLYGPRRFHFTHDLFTTSKPWVKEVCQALIKSDLSLNWTCSSRTDTVTAELLELMAAAGCSAIYFGLESGSERILTEIRKKIDLTHSFSILQQCLDNGIAVNVGFIGGFPTEDRQSLSETFAAYGAALDMGCAPVHFFQFTPFEDSSAIGQLDERICTGHFLDLPLGHELDTANRNLIAGDAVVFGAYHRPRRQSDDIDEQLIDGLEEFPTVVSSALVPALMIARSSGGMFTLYNRWINWISNFNRTRHAESYRQCFGTPTLFADFLVEQAKGLSGLSSTLCSMLKVIRMNHEIAKDDQTIMPTTMANYRTGLKSNNCSVVELSSTLKLGDVVGQLELRHDIEALLETKPPAHLPEVKEGPMYLIWHRLEPGRVQLLKVDAFTFYAVQELRASAKKAGEILQSWALRSSAESQEKDFFVLIDQLAEAAQIGLVQTEAAVEV